MAKKAEQNLYSSMKSNSPTDIRLERVENGVVFGMPDVHTIRTGKTVWFELKIFTVPKLPNTPVVKQDTFEIDQPKWHRAYAHHGGISFVLARDNRMQLFLIPGRDIAAPLQLNPSPNAPRSALQAYNYSQLKALYGVSNWTQLFERAFKS